MQHNKAETKFK